jgi:hypothetical protein
MTSMDESTSPESVAVSVRLTFREHACRPGQVRQRRCPQCTDAGCVQLDWAQRMYGDRGGRR